MGFTVLLQDGTFVLTRIADGGTAVGFWRLIPVYAISAGSAEARLGAPSLSPQLQHPEPGAIRFNPDSRNEVCMEMCGLQAGLI